MDGVRGERRRRRRDRHEIARGHLLGGLAVRRRQGDEPRGADRGRARRLLLDGAVADPREAGSEPESVETDARVYLRRTEGGYEIHKVELETVGTVPGVSEDEFKGHAETAKKQCPVSRALAGGPEITLEARLAG